MTRPPNLTDVRSLLDQAAANQPGALAIIHDDFSMSFSELRLRVQAIALILATRGVAAGDRIGCVVRHDAEDVLALAAVMYAGCCFVPIDPNAPTSRVDHVLTDSHCRYVIARPDEVVVNTFTDHSPTVIALSDLTGGTPDVDAELPPLTGDGLAYLIYTSGSTGLPKGVAISGRSLVRHAAAAAEAFGLRKSDRTLQFASLGFDVAQEEIWATWSAGGALVLNPAGVGALSSLGDIVARHAVTVLQVPTAFWRRVMVAGGVDGAQFATVRLVVIGSEAAWRVDLEAWVRSELAEATLVNAYGPTESVVTATCFVFHPGDQIPPGKGVPIGRALPGRTVHVLTADGFVSTPGARGRLYVSGLLAEGYLGRPDLTADRFPLVVGETTGPFYDTGDVAKVTTSGDLEFCGREDTQVKVRGFRIELEEIDTALTSAPSVSLAGTALIERANGEPFLAAAIVGPPNADRGELTKTADAYAREALPSYMVPTVLLVIDELPLNVNGKVDRARIAELVETRSQPSAATPWSSDLAAEEVGLIGVLLPLWRDVLGLDSVGPDTDFFEAGGDSLLAMQFTARARGAGWIIEPRDILSGRTLRAVAGRAVAAGPTTEATETENHLAVLPAQQRWLLDGEIPELGYFALAALFVVPVALELRELAQVAEALLDQHATLRTRLSEADGRPSIEARALRPVDVVSERHLADCSEETVKEACIAVQASLSPAAGNVFGLVLMTAPTGERRLLIVAHHFVLDGWSMALLVDDVEQLVTRAIAGEPVALPVASASPGRLAEQYNQLLDAPDLGRAEEEWLALPWHEVGPLPQDSDGRGLLGTLGFAESTLGAPQTAHLLKSIPPGERAVDLLTAAIMQSLAASFARPVQAVDVYVHNRDTDLIGLDLSRTLGYVQATYPVVRDVMKAPTDLGDLAAAIRSETPPPFTFDLLRFGKDGSEIGRLHPPTVRLNYRGHLERLERRRPESPLQDAPEPTGPNRSWSQWERYQLMFEGDIINGEFVVALKYSRDHYLPATVQALTDAVVWRLEEHAAAVVASADASSSEDWPAELGSALGWLSTTLSRPDLTVDSDLVAAGLDSLGATALLGQLPPKFAVDLVPADVLSARSLSRLVALRGTPGSLRHDAATPLTEGQLAIWLDDQMRAPGDLANVLTGVFELDGAVDGARLAAACAAVVGRQSALRTAIRSTRSGEPVTYDLSESAAVVVSVIPDGGRTIEPDDEVVARVGRQIRLDDGPLVAIEIATRLDRTRVAISMHHCVADGNALASFADQASRVYAAGPSFEPRPFGAFAAEQHERARLVQKSADGRAWTSEFGSSHDLAWPVVGNLGGGPLAQRQDLIIEMSGFDALSEIAAAHGVTPFVIGLAAFGQSLRDVTGETRFAIGVPMSAQTPAYAETIGCFITLTPVLLDVSQDAPTAEWLQQVAASTLASMRNQSLGLPQILRACGRRRSAGRALIQAQFSWPDYRLATWPIPGVVSRELPLLLQEPQYDVTLELFPRIDDAGDVRGVLEFDETVVAHGTAKWVVDAFQQRLDGLLNL